MAFPTGSTVRKLTSDNTKVSGSSNLTDFTAVATGANFPATAFSNSQGKQISSNWLASDSGLRAYYRLENTTDETANSYDLTNSGSTPFNSAKFSNGGDTGTGNSTKGFYVLSNLGISNPAISTISMWVKMNAAPGTGVYYRLAHLTNSNKKSLALVYKDVSGTKKLSAGMWLRDTSYVENEYTVDLGTTDYHHILYTGDGVTSKVYLNGVLVISWAETGSGTGASAMSNGFGIGCWVIGSDTPAYFTSNAIYDDVAVLDRPMSDLEAKSTYTGGADLRFATDEAGDSQIPHEVANWDPDNSEAEIHLKVPTLSYNTDTDIYYAYGGTSVHPVGREIGTMNGLKDDANLQGYWKLADGTDETANGYDLTGTAPTYTTGKFGNGADFEASSSQYLSIADASCANLEISGSQTWACWIKKESDAPAAGYRIMSKGKLSNANARKDIFVNVNQEVVAGFYDGSTRNVTSNAKIANGVWYHVAAVYNATDQKIYLYINGALDNTGTAGSSTTDSNAPFAIGCAYFGTSDTVTSFFDGIIDDAAVFNRALTAQEIASIYGSSGGAWGSNYQLVIHDPSNPVDSTVNKYAITNNGVSQVTGKIGNAGSMVTAQSDYLDVGNNINMGTNDFTLQTWIYPTAWNSNNRVVPFMKRTTAINAMYWGYVAKSGTVDGTFNIFTRNSAGTSVTASTSAKTGVLNAWSWYASTRDSSGVKAYYDGGNVGTGSGSAVNTDNTESLNIGRDLANSEYDTSYYDEIRILRGVALSADWLATEYNNHNSPSTFWTESALQTDATLTSTLTLTDNIDISTDYSRSLTGAITLTDNIDIASQISRELSSALTVAEVGVDTSLILTVYLDDSLSIADSLDVVKQVNRSLQSQITTADNIDITATYGREASSAVTLTDSIDNYILITASLTSSVVISDNIDRVLTIIGKSIAQIDEVKKTKPTINKIDKDKPILYSIRKG